MNFFFLTSMVNDFNFFSFFTSIRRSRRSTNKGPASRTSTSPIRSFDVKSSSGFSTRSYLCLYTFSLSFLITSGISLMKMFIGGGGLGN